MSYSNNQNSILTSSNQQKQDEEPQDPQNLCGLMIKNYEFYDQLGSTNNQSYLYSQLYAPNQYDQELINVVQIPSQQAQNKKSARPEQSQSQKSQQYIGHFQDDDQFIPTLSKNKWKKKKRVVKGECKNFLPFFYRAVRCYFQKIINKKQNQKHQNYFVCLQLQDKDAFKTIKSMINKNIKQVNRHFIIKLLHNDHLKQHLNQMFENRYINREIMCSRITASTKIIYLKNVEVFKNIFIQSYESRLHL